MIIPKYLTELGSKSPINQAWVNSLPTTIENLKDKWALKIGRPYRHNATCSLVLRCTNKEGIPVALKIGLPHEEALHEIEGLKLLNGKPTVKLLNFDKDTNAMLLEKCVPGTSLNLSEEQQQDQIIAELLKEIWKSDYTNYPFRSLGQMVSQWNTETYHNLKHFPDPELAKRGCQLKNQLIQNTERHVLLATDLHAGNVLKSQRKPWLVIDIKPYIGDPTYDLTQHLLNCKGRLQSNPLDTINKLAELAEVNALRLKEWIFARLASEQNGGNQKIALKIGK